jgi:uncharacterized protein (DUF1697 family)
MNTFISMLRGINVSGQKKIRMVELQLLYESLDLLNVKTYVQSGNVVFDSAEQDAAKVAGLIGTKIEQVFGCSVPVLIRGTNDFQRIVNGNPFLIERNEDPTKLHVTFLYDPPSESKLSGLEIPNNETGEFFVGEQEIFLFCPDGYGKTKLSNNFFERKLGVSATTRNWKTVNALLEMSVEQ